MSGVNEQQIVSFLRRLEPLGPLLQAVAGRDMQVLIEIRPGGRRVLIDLTARPVRVIEDAVPPDAAVGLAGTAEDLHATFLGRLGVMRGIGERRLLLRGGMSQLVRMFPVIDLLPALYGEHLHAGEPPRSPGLIAAPLGRIGRLIGAQLAGLDRRDLLAALTCLARGLARISPNAQEPAVAPQPEPAPHLLARPALTPGAARRRNLRHRTLLAMGLALGVARYRLALPVDLFGLLDQLACGLGGGENGG